MHLKSSFKLQFALMILLPSIGSLLAETPGKTLLIVAHPDDEYYFAATVYRMAVQLGGRVDELIITNGEGGLRYSTLAEPYYKKSLTIEAVGRKELPAIRKKEAINAGKVLGIKKHFFLGQKDAYFTIDSNEGPVNDWNSNLVISKILTLLNRGHYKYVLVVLPRSTTHGHHQAADVFAARAIRTLPEALRPTLLGFDTDSAEYVPSPEVRKSNRWSSAYAYAFDRTTAFGFHNALSYQIVVDWMIAEHKSQGLLQTMNDKDPKEYIWIDHASTPQAESAATSLFKFLGPNPVHDGK
jgi:LmbE family N-acetylglucosaminyl deacetylase